MTDMLYVNVYEVGRPYGGPEEGGWYYDAGTPIASIPVERTEEDARAALREQGLTDEQITAFWQDHVRYGDPEWLEVDNDRFAKVLGEILLERARKLSDEWAERYPRTGKRGNVLGGEDYSVFIEEHFARPYPEERPRYE